MQTERILLILAVVAILGIGAYLVQNSNNHSDCPNGVCPTPNSQEELMDKDDGGPEVIVKGCPEDYKRNPKVYFIYEGRYYHRHFYNWRDGRPHRCRPHRSSHNHHRPGVGLDVHIGR